MISITGAKQSNAVYFTVTITYCILISLIQCLFLIILESVVNILPNRNNETGQPINVYSSIPFSSMNMSYFVSTIYVAVIS